MSAKRITKDKRNMIICGWLFISPLLIGLLLFVAFPLIYAVILSFCEYDLFTSPKWIAIDNFKEMVSDKYFMKSLLNALVYCLNIPIRIVLALLVANILAGKIKGSGVFRMIYYIPTICGAVAITFIWQWMMASEYGLFYKTLNAIGIKPIAFLDKRHFMGSMIAMSVWCSFGVSLLLLFATIKNVPKSLYEAAEIDGANPLKKLIHITVPAVSPILFYLLITGIIGSFQEFTLFNVMSGGNVTETNIMPVWWIYNFTGKYGYRYGYASALGVVLGAVLVLLSVLQFRLSKKWVFYS